MRILVLDDIRHRHDVFDRRYAGDEVFHAYRFHEFVDMLENDGPWDLVHLDHDLGDFVSDPDTKVDGWGKRREYTGLDAADWICGMEDPPARVIIQSVNPVGGRAMLQALKNCGISVRWEPFCDDDAPPAA